MGYRDQRRQLVQPCLLKQEAWFIAATLACSRKSASPSQPSLPSENYDGEKELSAFVGVGRGFRSLEVDFGPGQVGK